MFDGTFNPATFASFGPAADPQAALAADCAFDASFDTAFDICADAPADNGGRGGRVRVMRSTRPTEDPDELLALI